MLLGGRGCREQRERLGAAAPRHGVVDAQGLAVGVGDRQLLVAELQGAKLGVLDVRGKTIAQGATTSVLVATSPALEGIGGRYFEDCNEAERLPPHTASPAPSGVAPYALDPDAAERLWALSLAATRA